ncbi:MAG TPA: bifunctional DNA-formamidopyrimidine glycosylase/DNA-(apurinic or apyrimidinic site) lyase [Geminicoccaceae bacterium]
MPELPEVETIRRALALQLTGRRITGLIQRRPDLRFPLPAALPERLSGRLVEAVRRRAKYLIFDLDDGAGLILHLGMSGRLILGGAPQGPHEHLTFEIAGLGPLRFVDPRRFGMLDLWPRDRLEQHPRLAHLGLEPLDATFDGAALQAVLAGRRSLLKIALMDQRLVVGVGNIYASEALFRARLSPRRTAGWLGPRQTARLARSIRAVLEDAIGAGGSSLRDYVQTDGGVGFFQDRFAVYGREGAPCPTCAGPIRRLVQASRATFLCPRCQR